MKKVVIIDAGPRKGWNTDQLLTEAERGAKEAGAEVQRFRLFDLNVKDCYACMACKRVGNRTEGLCAQRDDLRPVLEACYEADGIVIGSPIYFGTLTAEAHAAICRLMFPLLHYSRDPFDPLETKKHVGLILAMNVQEANLGTTGYKKRFDETSAMMGRFLGSGETLYSCDTLQFDDYSKYYANMFNEDVKRAHREKQCPTDLANAYEVGKRAAAGVQA